METGSGLLTCWRDEEIQIILGWLCCGVTSYLSTYGYMGVEAGN